LGITRLRLGGASQALEALQHARNLKPSDPEVYINMIAAYRNLHNTSQAGQILLEGMTLAPQDPQLLEELARAYPSCPIGPGADLLHLNRQCPDLHQHLCEAEKTLVHWLADNTYAKEASQAENQARDHLGCRN